MTKRSSTDTVRLGLMAPISGLVSLYGPEISWAGRLACEEVNTAGGILGRPLELIVADDGSLPETAVPAAERLIDEAGCVAFVGNLLSNSRIAVANRVADPRRVPHLNFSFYEGSISSRYFFHFAALPNQQIDRMIPYMADRFGPKMFFAGSNYEWPRGSIDAAKLALAGLGGEVVGEAYLPIGTTEIDELLEGVSKSGADVFVPYFAGADQIGLLTRFSELGLKDRMAVVMGHYDEAMVGHLPPEVRAGFFSSNTYFMSVDTPANRAYLERLGKLPEVSGIWPRGNGVLTNFGEGTYVCVKAFAEAARKAGSLDAEDLVAALETVAVSGPQGEVRMDPTTHHATVNGYLACCGEDGTFEIIESFGRIDPVIPARYRHLFDLPGPAEPPGPEPRTSRPSSLPPDRLFDMTGIALLSADKTITYVNEAFLRLWHSRSAKSFLGRPASELWQHPAIFEEILAKKAAAGTWSGILEAHLRDEGAGARFVRIEPVHDEGQALNGFALTCLDMSTLDSQMVASKRALGQILSIADTAIIATDEAGHVLQANETACNLFGYAETELLGLSVHLLVPPPSRAIHSRFLEQFLHSDDMSIPMGRRGFIAGYRKDGSEFPAQASISKVRSEDGWILVATLHDVTERKRVEEELTWQATHDSLTKLPNRALIRDRIEKALNRTIRAGKMVGLLFIDLDGFKLVNDSHGHDVGDELLIEVANRLIGIVRPGDTLARLGGDEFVILCEQIDEEARLASVAQRVVDDLRNPFLIRGQTLFVSASVGMALGIGETVSPEALLRNADAAMYQAKEQGRDNWKIFNDEIHERAKRELALGNGLRTALERDEMRLLYQPIVEVASRHIVGAEALIRWFPPEGPVPPDRFIPVAEKTGAISAIGQWVLEEACRAQARWSALGGGAEAPYVSVNVSTRQLDDSDLIERFRRTIMNAGTSFAGVLLEITETSLMRDVEANLRTLNGLGELGLAIAVDDFGTGYSSLGQLLRMPVHYLKIDRAFVRDLETVKNSRAIAAAIISMAHALDIKVIAEGVETEGQLEILRGLGCDRAQGYLFSRPVPEGDLFLLRHKRAL